jgi:hypothetical protein
MLDTIVNLFSIGVSTVTIGGALYALRKFRTTLQLEVSGTLIRSGEDRFVIATSRMRNSGLSKIILQQSGSGLIVSVLRNTNPQAEFVSLDGEAVAAWDVFGEHQWLVPDETVESQNIISVPKGDAAALLLRLRVVARGRTGTGNIVWNATSIVPLVDESPDQ